MGLTVEQVIERAYEEILEAGGTARPAFDIQSGSITSSGTSLTLEGRQTYIPADGLVEWWDDSMEVAEVKSVSSTTITLQTRGYLTTTAASHSAGVKIVLDNPYPRQLLLNGLKAVIGQLYGYGLYQKSSDTTKTYNAITPIDLPTGAKDTFATILVSRGSGLGYNRLLKGNHFEVLYEFTPPKVQFFHGGSQGLGLTIGLKKDFDVSTFALTTDLETTVGLPATLIPHLSSALAGHVLMGRDVPQLESEYIPPDPQPSQLGSKMNVGRALWTSFISGPVYSERVRNLEVNPTNIVFERI